ncbi:hypothetical protein BFJ72_g9983 [Fusarium proliferatum]|uniref:Amidohydrolase 3 domain-containing protein n=1 Tax=Gibberella intermedia TaxID=948311 RepID=A0A420SW33_GIBIN|nr:hypothetical protein BFJ72_g9983 [Fusarium proliferatum]
MAKTLFVNGRILSKTETGLNGNAHFSDCMLIQDDKIVVVGSGDDIPQNLGSDIEVRDLDQRVVLPSFIDGHMHLLLLGQSLRKLDLSRCTSLEDIRSCIRKYASENPDTSTILCKGWRHYMTPGGVTAAMLDDLDPRPIFVDAGSLHSCWCNTAALKELEVDYMPDPAGGKIYRDTDGKPSGLLDEGAMMSIIWPFQAKSSPKHERIEAIRAAVKEYNAAGYTGAVEMAMDEEAWDALVSLKETEPNLSLRIAAHWLIKPTANLEQNSKQVQRAIELSKLYNSSTSPDLRLVGIKVITDGIVDACTAYLSEPYATAGSPPPIWEPEFLEPVVREADAGGLQVALHAIGDGAVRMAINAIEKHATPGRRHRIEHLELVSPEDAKRLGRLGLTASIQPIHADPTALTMWPELIGDERYERAFAYREFADAGALMAIGTDSPTSPWSPMHNFHVAINRQSSKSPENPKIVHEHFRLGLCETFVAATEGAARSVFAEDRVGSLTPGKLADFIVVDMEWDPKTLLKAEVRETWFGGSRVF